MNDPSDFMESARVGLINMFKDLNYWSVLEKWTKERKQMLKHPFGLEVIEHNNFSDKIYFLGKPGQTDVSISAMLAHIRWSVAGTTAEDARPLKLRVIFTEKSDDSSVGHNVYFEFRSRLGIFICGGCTDYSGEGGGGKRKLDGVFALFSLLYDIKIEEITILHPESGEMEKQIRALMYVT